MRPRDRQSRVTVSTFERPAVAVRPLALPAEHGAWGLLLEPVVLALLVAPSRAGLLIGVGAVAAFLARHPLKLAAQDLLRRRRYPRTTVCVSLALTYASIAIISLGFAARDAGVLPLVALSGALPFAGLQFALDVRNRGRSLTAELCGAVAPAAIAAAIAVAASSRLAIPLVILTCARSLPAVLYVRFALRGGSRVMMLAAHAGAIGAAILSGPSLAVAAMGLLFVRAMMPPALPPKAIGMREIGWGAVTITLIAAAYL